VELQPNHIGSTGVELELFQAAKVVVICVEACHLDWNELTLGLVDIFHIV
jgi:hypothetical protein